MPPLPTVIIIISSIRLKNLTTARYVTTDLYATTDLYTTTTTIDPLPPGDNDHGEHKFPPHTYGLTHPDSELVHSMRQKQVRTSHRYLAEHN